MVGVWLFLFSATGWSTACSARSRRTRPGWSTASGDADHRAVRDLEAARLLHPALPRRAAEHAEGALRVGGGRRRRASCSRFLDVTVPGVRPATTLVVILATITGANLFTEPYLLTGGGGPNGASTSPVLLMYQQGIEQGTPAIASAIGVMLVIGVHGHLAGQPLRAGEGVTMATSVAKERASAGISRRDPRRSLLVGPAGGPRRAGARRARLPVPLLLHGGRLAAARTRHRRHGRVPEPGQPDARTTTATSTPQVDLVRIAAQLGHLHRRRPAGTVVFGVLAGYALARLHFRGRGTCSPRCCWSWSCRSSC